MHRVVFLAQPWCELRRKDKRAPAREIDLLFKLNLYQYRFSLLFCQRHLLRGFVDIGPSKPLFDIASQPLQRGICRDRNDELRYPQRLPTDDCIHKRSRFLLRQIAAQMFSAAI